VVEKPENLLCYGDNLVMLREYVSDAAVDLVYLDPPFKSDANYNMLFKERDGSRAAAQIQAFKDTWTWDAGAALAFEEAVDLGGHVAKTLIALRAVVGDCDLLAYLSMMTPRLVELRRVLKPTGSLYLHCDPAASHYLKLLLDSVFGAENFRNEIVWKRTVSHNNVRNRFGDETDTILFYSRSARPTFNLQYRPYSEAYVKSHYSQVDSNRRRFTTRDLRNPGVRPNLTYDYKGYKPHPNGWAFTLQKMKEYDAAGLLHFPENPNGRIRLKRYLDEMPGTPMGNVWDDILPLNSQAQERLGYPTQKPVALLDRILQASSNPGDVVLDPFCGCGTTIESAQKLGRAWIGIDVTHLAISLIKKRLLDSYGNVRYRLKGEPATAVEAGHLAKDPIAFQDWILQRIGARPGARGSDRGIDGIIQFRNAKGSRIDQVIVSVKAGRVQVSHLRDLNGVVTREKAAVGVLISLEPPTRAMKEEAASAGFFQSDWGKHPRLQLLTVEDLFEGRSIDYPRATGTDATFKKSPKAKTIPRARQADAFEHDPLAGTPLSRARVAEPTRAYEVTSPPDNRRSLRPKTAATRRRNRKHQ
jgi:site-specific DNA-methyltransferase (adenine-specific)